MKDKNYINGIDVSHRQGLINWEKVAADKMNVKFVFVKCTEGVTYVDRNCKNNIRVAAENKLLTGVYHFYRTEFQGTPQAIHLFDTIQDLGISNLINLPLVVDVEFPKKVKKLNDSIEKELNKFVTYVMEATRGKPPILYTNNNFWDNLPGNFNGGHPNFFGNCPLWISHYTIEKKMRWPAYTWNDWKIWQYSDKGKVNGINGYVDLNYFKGTLEDLKCL